MIFGIDDKKLLPTQDEYIFAKISRTLDLNTKDNSRITFDKLLSSNIENVIFYGHSLSIADYGYFRMIFEKYLERENVIFYFVFRVYPGTTKEKERKKLIKSISELFGEYSIDKENNTDIFKKSKYWSQKNYFIFRCKIEFAIKKYFSEILIKCIVFSAFQIILFQKWANMCTNLKKKRETATIFKKVT